MADWKRAERHVARMLGTGRIPNSGHAQPDIVAGPFAIEHKCRATLPQWLLDAVLQAERNAGAGQTPLVVLTMPRGRGRQPVRLVVMRFADWVDWHGQG